MCRGLAGHTLGDNGLDHVTGDNVLAGLLDHALVVLPGHVELEVGVCLALEVGLGNLGLFPEPGDKLVDPSTGIFVRAFDVALDVSVAYDLYLVTYVVEHQICRREHEYRLGQSEGIFLWGREAFEVLYGIVGDVSDRTAVEFVEIVDVGQLVLRQHLLYGIQRIDVSQMLTGAGLHDLHGVGADKAVAREAFASFDALKQVRIWRLRDLQVCRHRCFEVGAYLSVNRYEVRVTRVLFELFECWIVHSVFLTRA